MAKNFKFSGKRITIKAIAANVTSGKLTREKGFIGIPLNNVLAGGSVSFALEGVWGLTYDDYAGLGLTLAAGSMCYWDTSAAKLSCGIASGDFVTIKCITAVSASDGSFDGLLLPQGRPDTVEQA